MTRNTLCTLSTDNLLHNLAVIRAKAPKAKIMAMVKANAYGHGIRSVSQRLEGHVDALGVASIDEAIALRKANVKTPITLIEGVFAGDELQVASEQGFSVVFHSQHQIEWLKEAGASLRLHSWLKLNTGMGRLGFAPEEAEEPWQALSKRKSIVEPVGIVSHFACADEPKNPMNAKQIAAFRSFADSHPGPKSLCNSAGIFAFPDAHYDWVRPGIALYGASPLAGVAAESLGLKPVMTFQTEIIAIQKFARGDSVGYGAGFVCPRDMSIGVIAVGYGDGYPRVPGKNLPVLINGKKCPLVGRISMDMAAVDLGACPSASVGDKVVLWGEGLPVDELEALTGRFSYDLLTNVQNRVKFVWEAATQTESENPNKKLAQAAKR